MKSSGDSFPCSTCFSRFSHSAVSSGDCSISGRTVMRELPSWVGIRLVTFLAFFRSTKPEDTSFSRMLARVAGVPMPLRSTSSGISSTPAVSMLFRIVSSVKCRGGVVLPSFTRASFTVKVASWDRPSGRVSSLFGSLSA